MFSGIEGPVTDGMISTWLEFIGYLMDSNRPLNDADKKFVESCEYVKNTYLKVMKSQLNLK